MGIRCLQRPTPGRSAQGHGLFSRVSEMTTMGLRGTLAVAFILSTGLLTGMAATPSGAADSGFALHEASSTPGAGPGLIDRFKRKACEISLAATNGDRARAQERGRHCNR